jgi:hypothetical protein
MLLFPLCCISGISLYTPYSGSVLLFIFGF